MTAAAQKDVIPGQLHSLFRRRCHAYVFTVTEMQKRRDGFRWKTNSYLEQPKMVQREPKTSRWHSQMPLTLVLPSEFFGSASHFAPTLLFQLVECEGWSRCSCYCLFVLQEQEVAPFTDPPSSFWSTGHPFHESLYDRACRSYTRQDKRARKTKIGEKDKATVKL